MKLRKVLLIVAFAAMPLITTGCLWDECSGKAVGGGWITGIDCESHANIGFEVQKDGPCARGNVQYNDHSKDGGLMFHGVIEWVKYVEENKYKAGGTAEVGPKKLYGEFEICVEDNGEPGCEDWVKVELKYWDDNCDKFKYCNWGLLQGGNIQVMEEKDKD